MKYMECPKEPLSVAEKFVEDGNNTCGEHIYVIGELSELINAIAKVERATHGKNIDKYFEAYDNLVEEIAHVYLVLNHLRIHYDVDIHAVQTEINNKIKEYGFE